jgi:hypothetical protein
MNNHTSDKKSNTVPARETLGDLFADAPVIFSYTRKQAIEDGVLVDLTAWAKETGFRIPVACTSALWQGYIVPPAGTRQLGQSERGRAHDVLWMLFLSIQQRAAIQIDNDCLQFAVIFLQAPQRQETVTFKAICGPGDDGEPVLTVMLPNED